MADIVRPIEPFELTQGFGDNYESYKQFGLKGHNGWDIKTKYPDTPQGFRDILASCYMQFYRQGFEGDKVGYGLFFETVAQLYSTWKLTFAHCKSVHSFTSKNEGESMGISDNTGNSTGSHLHLTVKRIKIVNGQHQVQDYNNGYFGAVNPQEFFDEVRKWKKEKGSTQPPKQEVTMTISEQLYGQLVDGASTRKDLALWIKNELGGQGFDDPDKTPLDKFKSYINGLRSRITDLENQLSDKIKELAIANTEIKNQKDKVANVEAECQRKLDIEKARYDKLKETVPDTSKLEGYYKGQISELQDKLREAQKNTGLKDLQIAELTEDLRLCKSGVAEKPQNPIQSLVDLIKKLLG
jgi:hypothetical protein